VLNTKATLATFHIKYRLTIAFLMLTSFAPDIDHDDILMLDAIAPLAAFQIKCRIYDIASVMLASCMLDIDHACFLVLTTETGLASF